MLFVLFLDAGELHEEKGFFVIAFFWHSGTGNKRTKEVLVINIHRNRGMTLVRSVLQLLFDITAVDLAHIIQAILLARAAGITRINAKVRRGIADHTIVALKGEGACLTDFDRDRAALVGGIAEGAECTRRILKLALVEVIIGRSTLIEEEHGDEQEREEGEEPDEVVHHADIGNDAEAELRQRITLSRLRAQLLLLRLFRAFLDLLSIDDVSCARSKQPAVFVVGASVVCGFAAALLVRDAEGNAVAAARGDPFQVRESHVDRILLNRVDLINQFERIVNLSLSILAVLIKLLYVILPSLERAAVAHEDVVHCFRLLRLKP